MYEKEARKGFLMIHLLPVKNSGFSFDKRMKCPKIQNSRQSFCVQTLFYGVNNDDSQIEAPNCPLIMITQHHCPRSFSLLKYLRYT